MHLSATSKEAWVEDVREVGGGMVACNPRFSRNFHNWEMDAIQNFILKLHKFGRIRMRRIKRFGKTGVFFMRSFYVFEAKGEVSFPSKIIWGS